MEHATRTNEPDSEDGHVSRNAWNEEHALSGGDCVVLGTAKIRIEPDGSVSTLARRGRIYANFSAQALGSWSAPAALDVPMTASGVAAYAGMVSVMPLDVAAGYSVDVDVDAGSNTVVLSLTDAAGDPAYPPAVLTISVVVFVACSIPVASA